MTVRNSLMIALLLSAAGCDTDNNRTDRDDSFRTTRSTQGTTRAPQTPGAQGSTVQGQAGANVSQDARNFVHEAYSGNLFEVQSSQLVLQGNPDPQIERLAQRMIQDHQRANQELQSIASRKGISVPQQLSPKHQQMLQRLRSASTEQVATQYHSMQVQAHQEAVALYDRASQNLQDQELRSYAQRTLPTLREHLNHVQQVRPGSSSTNQQQPRTPIQDDPHEMPDMDDEPGGVEP